ncbi:MAG: DUF2461 domain-containing protein, partial [Bacteroidia bacterium]|nr:DUF2461 domain-containing protein [Bacteroidia bacterium]
MAISVPQKTFDFFKSLGKNNNREWFNVHKDEFKSLETDIKNFYNKVLENLKEHDDVDKLKMFRIYR